jgi:hypothetical protein
LSKRVGIAIAVSALTIAVITTAARPANARVDVSIGVPIGVPYYYAPPPPAYYPAPVATYGGCGWGAHWVPAHYSRIGQWVPGHCRPNY